MPIIKNRQQICKQIRLYFVYLQRYTLKQRIEKYKEIHPGRIINRELRKRDISQRDFAASIGEHSQTLNAVITGRRNLTTEMAIKFEQLLGYEEGFLLTLQVFHPIAEYKNRLAAGSVNGVPIVRRVLFWDADFDTVDWGAMFFGTWRRGGECTSSVISSFFLLSRI